MSKTWMSQTPCFNPLKPTLCVRWNFNSEKMQTFIFRYRYLYEECFSTIPKTVSYFAAEKVSKTRMSQIPFKINPLCTLKLEFGKIHKLFLGYLYEESFSKIPTAGILFCGRENLKNMNIIDTRFNPLKSTLCTPWKSDFEKCRNWFLGTGICMKNLLVQFRRRYLIFAAEKVSKTWMSQIPRINPLCTLKLEFGKIHFFGGISMKKVLVQFRKWYLILRPRKCKIYECRRYPILPLCAPGTLNFEKCRNRFLGICMF